MTVCSLCSFAMEDSIHDICALVGLNHEVVKNISKLPVNVRNHRTDLDWIEIWLEDHCPQTMYEMTVKEQLCELGFTVCTTEILVSWLKHNPFVNSHQNVMYFAKSYFNAMLSTSEPRPHLVNTELEPCIRKDVPKSSDEFRVLFHGTSKNSAMSIAQYGVEVYSGSLYQDFSDGDGFYLTEDLTYALKWARCKQFPCKPAVVVFKIPVQLLDSCTFKITCGDEWQEIVKYNRTGRHLMKFDASLKIRKMFKGVDKVDWIEGPICHNASEVMSGQTDPVPSAANQVCILSDYLGDKLSELNCIHSVLIV